MKKHVHRARSFRVLQEARFGRRALHREYCACGFVRKRVPGCSEAECGGWRETIEEHRLEHPAPEEPEIARVARQFTAAVKAKLDKAGA